MEEILGTTKTVVDSAEDVGININEIDHFCKRILDEEIGPPSWDFTYHLRVEEREMAAYLLVLDSLNFCFWPKPRTPRWEIEDGQKVISGYNALAFSLKKAFENGVPLSDAKYLANMTKERLKSLLGGRGELQLMDERVGILNELGRVLLREYRGRAYRLVEEAGHSAVNLAFLLGRQISSFRDETGYSGRPVFFYKRAQIFAADLYGALGGKGYGGFKDIHKLTAFADYKLPQVLRHLGILYYSKKLAQKVDKKSIIQPGSPEEVEIRSGTIWAVEFIRRKLGDMEKCCRPFEIDCMLWNMGQNPEFKKSPYHRTVTIFY